MSDDVLSNKSTNSLVAVGGSVTGEIESSGDEDWHAISLLAGETYLIDLKGADGDWGTLADPVLWYIYDASGSSIAEPMTIIQAQEKTAFSSLDLRRAVPIT